MFVSQTSLCTTHVCMGESMPAQTAEFKGHRHGKSVAFMWCHYQSASEMRFNTNAITIKLASVTGLKDLCVYYVVLSSVLWDLTTK